MSTQKISKSALQNALRRANNAIEQLRILKGDYAIQSAAESSADFLIKRENKTLVRVIRGPDGKMGVTGLHGAPGGKGNRGEKGIKGDQGVKGTQGARGYTGNRGEHGEKGEFGTVGGRGERGITGIQGIQGISGEKGDTGLRGVPGMVGEHGEQGIQGFTGMRGESGSIGKTGGVGPRGHIGEKGIPGNVEEPILEISSDRNSFRLILGYTQYGKPIYSEWILITNLGGTSIIGAPFALSIKSNDSQVGDSDIHILDFSTDFNVTESPNGEINISSAGGAGHSPVTLDVNADAFFSLTGQELGIDTQAKNLVAAGPISGVDAVPTWRSLIFSDVGTGTPDATKYLKDDMSWDNITWAQLNLTVSDIADIATKSHTSLSDVGSNSHSVIDTHLASTSDPHNIIWAQVDKGTSDIADITTKSHTSLSDIGDNTHANVDAAFGAYNGTFIESMTFVVTSNGSTITGTIDKNPTGDLTERFNDGYSTLSSGGTVTLTVGTAAAPKKNYVYVLQSNKGVLVVSTSDWPSAEHIKVAEVVVQTAALVQSDGVLSNRNWNDFRKGTDGQGHHSHVWERLRWEHSAYRSGSAVTWSITAQGAGTDDVDLAITAGKAYQLHLQSVGAFDTTDPDNVYVVNQHTNQGGAYFTTNNLEDLLTDSSDVSMSTKYFNLVVWCSVSSGSETEKVFINLPSGAYNKQGDATADVSGHDNYTIPSDFRGYAYLVNRITLRHQAASSGTWTNIQEVDLRGQVPNIIAGGGTASITTEFADSQFKIFDDVDPTKELGFQVSGVSASTTRTITMPDSDVTLHNIYVDASAVSAVATADDYIKNDGDVGTGVFDFGGADSFEIPNGAAPTVDAAGEIAVDTTITDHTALIRYFGAEELIVIAVPTDKFTTTDGHVIAYNAANNEFEMKAAGAGGGVHGPGDHTEFANWKVIYTNGSGDQQELSLGAAATFLRSAGVSSAPTMSAIAAGDLPTATTSAKGVVELATTAEIDAATPARAIMTDALGDSNYGERTIGFLVSDPGGDAITTGDGKVYARIPSTMNGWNLVEVAASLSTVSSSGIPTVQVRRSRRSTATTRADADMLSTKLTIDQSEFDSEDAATAAVIKSDGTESVNEGDHIYIDIDVAGTGALGLFVTLTFRLP